MNLPKIGEHIIIYKHENNKVTIYNKNTSKMYELGERESKVISLIDGKTSIEKIHRSCNFYSIDDLNMLFDSLSKIGLFEKQKNKFNIFKINIPLFNPNTMIKNNSVITKLLFFIITILCPAIFVIGFAFNLFFNQYNYSLNNIIFFISQFDISYYITLAVSIIVCLFLHELGHTVVARYYKVNVPEIGIMLIYFLPVAYTNLTGINLLYNKKEKLLSLASGILVNLGIIGILYLASGIFLQSNILAFLSLLIISNYAVIFINCIFFAKFDGYYMTEILLDEPGLKENSNMYFNNFVSSIINKNNTLRYNLKNQISYNPDLFIRHYMYIIYSIASYIFIPLLFFMTVISIF